LFLVPYSLESLMKEKDSRPVYLNPLT